ncbi:MAG: tetratricopeptide repeat protein [Candidatus Niyogibacteria bacterium]|nr:tetratricopeptide repeat protein [Candidatus Niyogibacteria bacterium]
MAYFLILVALLAWLLSRIKSGSVSLPQNYMALGLALVVFVWAISGVFSASRHISFSGLSADPSGVVPIFMFAVAAFMAYFYLRSAAQVFFWIFSFFTSAGIIFLVQLLRLLFGINPVPWISFASPASNLFGSWTELGILFSMVLASSLFLFEIGASKAFKSWFFVLAVLSFAVVALVNSPVVWWVLFAFLLVILAYLFSFRTPRLNVFRPTFFFLLAVLFFIQIPTLSSAALSYLGIQSIEIRPSWSSSWSVIQKTLEENTALGSGPGTFVYDWLRYKPAAVNLSPFWAVRFSTGFGFWPSALAMTGVLGLVAFLFLFVSFALYGFRFLVRSGEEKSDPALAIVSILILMLLVYSFVYSLNFTFILFLFVFLGIFMALVSEAGLASEKQIALFHNSGSGFISALVIIFLLVAAFSSFYLLGQKYAAAYYFGKSVKLGLSGDIAGAETAFNRTIGLDPRDQYYRGIVDVGLSQMSSLLNRQDISPDDLRGRFQNMLSQAIQNAQTAVSLNEADPLNWVSLGRIYEAVVPFQISGASEFAFAAYREASLRDPSNPEILLAQARVALAAKQTPQARAFLEESLKLKGNYTPAHLLLAQIEDSEGNVKEAISRAEAAAILSPGDIGVLFQLGLLYYRDSRLENARQVFARAVELSPNYSNARYFLGLIYDRLGERGAAIAEFERVQALNPGTEEVSKILQNLRSGKKALAGNSPPGPGPEERKKAPIED